MKYVAYYRVSTARQGRSGLGLEAQRQAVAGYIGGAPDREFKEVESGKRSDRPQLKAALGLAELMGATLVVAKLDRLSRDAEFLNRLAKAPVRIVFADMPQADAFMIGIMAQIAQWEREQISKRTRAALAVAKGKGTVLGGDRGNLASVRAAGALASAASRSEAARRRAELVLPHIEAAKLAGHSTVRSIAGYLNRQGFKTARGRDWSGGAVSRLLRG